MSLSAPGVTSVSTPTTDVMESLTAAIAQMSRTVVSIKMLPVVRGYTSKVLHSYLAC